MNKEIKEWLDKNIEKLELRKSNKSKNNKIKICKSYIHFDKKFDFGKNEIEFEGKKQKLQDFFEVFFNSEKISERGFWPFMNFKKIEIKYKKKLKIRKINYASHFDSLIYSFYSFLLSEKYEKKLEELKIDKKILAYRRIDEDNEKKSKGKSNIHFARDVFEKINFRRKCYVFAFDVSGFFDNLDWEILEEKLKEILGVEKLFKDWKNVLNSITNYSYIEKKILEENKLYEEILVKNKLIKTKVDIKKFQECRKIYKKEKGESLIKKSPTLDKKKGIVQGSAISGMFANLYMIKFDEIINNYVENLGGDYYRYSDDIIIILPYNKENKERIFKEVKEKVFEKIGEINLKIQEEKTDIFDFEDGILQKSFSFKEGEKEFSLDKNKRPLQYLGFSFDGKKLLIKNKTLSNHYRKMIRNIKRASILRSKKIKGGKILLGKLNNRFSHSGAGKKGEIYGNFYGYTKESHKIMSESDLVKNGIEVKIKKQMSNYNRNYNKILKRKKLTYTKKQ